jgi:L-lactate dehydrogenase complex protein LldG
VSLLPAFKESLERMGSLFLEPPAAGSLLVPIRNKIAGAKVVCSTVPEIVGNRDIARIAVAETDSVLLSDAGLCVNALAYLAQHLIVLLDPIDIVVNIHHAYARPEFRSGHYAYFHTGLSATPDIEGVLIHGAQGVRSLSC